MTLKLSADIYQTIALLSYKHVFIVVAMYQMQEQQCVIIILNKLSLAQRYVYVYVYTYYSVQKNHTDSCMHCL
jgi:hypothetical protein